MEADCTCQAPSFELSVRAQTSPEQFSGPA
jgi:hypothetical protein